MDPKLKSILRKYKADIGDQHLESKLVDDLNLDSMNLIQIAMDIFQEFGVDLGDEADRGAKFLTVADIEQCLKSKT